MFGYYGGMRVPAPVPAQSARAVEDREWSIAQRVEAAYWRERALRAEQEVEDLKGQIEALKAKIIELQQMVFGRKSEKQGTGAAQSMEGEGNGETTPEEPAAKRPRGQQVGAPGHGRRRHSEVPAVEIIHELPEAERRCPHCGKEFGTLPGDETSEELDWEVEVRRKVHRRKRYCKTCRCPQTPAITVAPVPPKLIPKGLFSVSAISHLVVEKYLLARPTNKTLTWLQMNSGLRVSPGTVAGVMQKLHPLLAPLEEAILARNRAAHHWHGDETRWKVFAQVEGKKGYDWWLWVFGSADTVVFRLDPTRSGKVPKAHFQKDGDPAATGGGSTGILSCDRLTSYGGLEGILRSFCWAHQRRDFIKAACSFPKALKEWAAGWQERIGTLYYLHGEREAQEIGSADFAAADVRLREHVVEMAGVRDQQLSASGLHPGMEGPLQSLRSRWEGLTLFLDWPGLPLDNNEAERLLRTPVLGRKNFYGSGSQWSGQLAACVLTILGTAAKNGLNPLTYLTAYFGACAEAGGKAPGGVERFLPWNASEEDLADWSRPPPGSS